MLRRAIWASFGLLILGAIATYVGASRTENAGIGLWTIIGAGLCLLGFIGMFAGITTWFLTGLSPHKQKE